MFFSQVDTKARVAIQVGHPGSSLIADAFDSAAVLETD
jgi:hypothetical protein